MIKEKQRYVKEKKKLCNYYEDTKAHHAREKERGETKRKDKTADGND